MRFRGKLVAAAVVVAGALVTTGCRSGVEDAAKVPTSQVPALPEWPDVVCDSELPAWAMLDDIARLAFTARQEGRLPAPLYTEILSRVGKCKLNEKPTPMTPAEHCAWTRRAWDAAWEDEWELCKNELEHGH